MHSDELCAGDKCELNDLAQIGFVNLWLCVGRFVCVFAVLRPSLSSRVNLTLLRW